MYKLDRFTKAQEDVYQTALAEIKSGRKQTHWMWYIFPQIKGLGRSQTSESYGIASLSEAKAYLNDELLGNRLVEISSALLELETADALAVFGNPDNLKLKSSMTLFVCADPCNHVFQAVIDKFFQGKYCEKTLRLLKSESH